ncbi:hypothetical protein LCGC14_1218580 [marine sediment metagenome]|uniref:Uncharacterized protein n=1 Tax=marine sediment metagenome TaxID=412755 RepID=A0A0F9PGJ5_9ZZZZ
MDKPGKDYEGIIGDCLVKRVDKREEIREGIARIRFGSNSVYMENSIPKQCYRFADEVIKYLSENDVVIKAGRELPHYTGDEDYKGLLKSDIYLNAQDHMIKAGFGATERLIKE